MESQESTPAQANKSRRKFIQTVSGSVAVGSSVLLAGCSTGDESGSPTDGGGGGGDADDAGDSGNGGSSDQSTITFASRLDPFTLDPHLIADIPTATVAMQAYDNFFAYPGENNEITPRVAEDWSLSEDSLTYTFTIRDGIKFHDGKDLVAEDVKYSMDRALRMGGTPASYFGSQLSPDNVVVVDDSTVEMTLDQPVAPFIPALSWLFIVNSELVEENASSDGNFGEYGDYGSGWLSANSAGSGPWEITERETGSRIVWQANDDYWRDWPDNSFDEAVYDVISEAATLKQTLIGGGATMSDGNNSVSFFADLDEASEVTVKKNLGVRAFTIHMNTQHELLQDVNLRRGISYALNYDELGSIFSDSSKRFYGPIPEGMWGHNPDLQGYEHNQSKAQEEFDNASVSTDSIEINYHGVAGNNTERLIGLQLQSNLQEYGINLNVHQTPWSDLIGQQTQGPSGAVDMTIFFWVGPFSDPSSLMYNQYHSKFWTADGGSYPTSSFYENQQVDALLEDAQRTHDMSEREQMYQQAQELIMEDAPIITLYNSAFQQALQPGLQGYDFIRPYQISNTQRLNQFYM